MDDGVPQRSENESPWDHIRRIKERPDLRLRLHGDRSTHAPDGLPQVRLRVAKRTHERFSFRRVAGACAAAFFEQAEASGVAQRHPARVFTPQPLLTVTSTSPSDTHADDEEDRQQQQEQSGGGGGGGGGGGNNLKFGLHNLETRCWGCWRRRTKGCGASSTRPSFGTSRPPDGSGRATGRAPTIQASSTQVERGSSVGGVLASRGGHTHTRAKPRKTRK